MEKRTEDELLEELKRRFEEHRRALSVIKVMNGKLESLNAKLSDSEKLKTHFISNIRNEIVNPLSSILGLAESIIAKGPSPSDCSVPARLMHMEASRLNFQLQNIFAAAEVEAGDMRPTISHVNMDTLLRDVVESQKYHAEERQVTVSIAMDESERTFLTDPEKLELILANLLANAIEFNREGGRVTCSVEVDSGLMVISVADEGEGISGENLPKVFDRFGQLECGATKPHQGHGLGLSVTRALVELLNGTISVESGVGFGSTFTVTLPQTASDEEVKVFSEHGREFLYEEEGDVQEF